MKHPRCIAPERLTSRVGVTPTGLLGRCPRCVADRGRLVLGQLTALSSTRTVYSTPTAVLTDTQPAHGR